MFPQATNQVSAADPSWTSSAFLNLSEGLQSVFDPALGFQIPSSAANEKGPLSQSIADHVEDEIEQNAVKGAQDSRDIEVNHAQEQRIERTDSNTVDARSDGRDLNSRNSSGKMTRPPQMIQHPGDTTVRPPGMLQQMNAEKITQATTPIASTSESAAVTGITSPPAMRGIPAALLRAIEVESTLELGVRNTTLSGTSGPKATIAKGVRSLAEAELRTLQGMQALMARRGGRMRVQLHPVQLGSMSIDVKVDGNRVQATIQTSTKAAMNVLEASTSRLRLSLESQGFSLDRMDIRHDPLASKMVETPQSENDDRPYESNSKKQGRHRYSASNRHSSKEEFNPSEYVPEEIDS